MVSNEIKKNPPDIALDFSEPNHPSSFNIKVPPNILYKMTTPVEEDLFPNIFVEFCDLYFPYLYLIRDYGEEKNGTWVQYTDQGVYGKIDILGIRDKSKIWLRENGIKDSEHNTDECIARLSEKRFIYVAEFDKRDKNDPILNCKSGLWYAKTQQLKHHTPEYKSLCQIDAKMMVSTKELKFFQKYPIFMFWFLAWVEEYCLKNWAKMKQTYLESIDFLERFVQSIIRKDVFIKFMFYIVGRPNTGKSTVGQVIYSIFKSVASTQGVNEVGGDQHKWGLQNCIGKLLVYDSDSATDYFNKGCVKIWKRIIGDPETPYPTPLIFRGEKDILFTLFVLILSNQLPKIIPVEQKGMFKRSFVVEMDEIFNDDPNFEQNILLEKDWLFTYLCLRPYNRLDTRKNLNSHLARTKSLWDEWSEPMLMCFKPHFERSVNPDDVIKVSEVQDVVYDQMEEWGYPLGRRPDARLTELLKRLRISKANRILGKGQGRTEYPCYIGIKKTSPISNKDKDESISDEPIEENSDIEEKRSENNGSLEDYIDN